MGSAERKVRGRQRTAINNKRPKRENPAAQPAVKGSGRVKKRLNIDVKTVSILSFVILMAVIYVLLVGCYANYMRKAESLSMFLGTSSFLDNCMETPGGVLTWLSAFFTRFFHNPPLGAAIYVVILGCAQIVCYKALNLRKVWFAAMGIVPVLLLLSFVNLGYVIFTLKPAGHTLMLPLGILSAALLFWGFRLIGNYLWRMLAITLIVVAGYPLLGFYALLAAAMCALGCIARREGEQRWQSLMPMVLGGVLILVVPRLWFIYAGSELMESQMYRCGIPYFTAGETGFKAIYGILFALLLVGAVIAGRKNDSGLMNEGRKLRISAAVWVLSVASIFIFRYSDSNFRLTLDLDRALWNQDWNGAEEIAGKFKGEPTRLNTVLTWIAMIRNGSAPERMFAANYGWAPYKTTRAGGALQDAAASLISYHLGHTNYAYRWGMEYSIELGMAVERLKMMSKCALLNFELPLAKTYLEILYNMPAHREWANKYLHYQANPMEMFSDEELAAIKQQMCLRSEFINDGGSLEGYIWKLLAQSEPAIHPFNELSMTAALVSMDLDSFMAKLPDYAATAGRVPRHFQEAALLWSRLNNRPCPIQTDALVEADFNQFLKTFQSTSSMGAERQRDVMADSYGDTYWFYFGFHADKPLI